MIGFILAALFIWGLALLLRAIASRENPTIVTFVPAQMHALVTTKSNKETDVTKGGGNIVDAIHAVPGRILDKSPMDPMNWYYKLGRESRGILYYLLGIQFIGIFRYLRLNDVRTFRFGRKDEESAYRLQAKSDQTRYVFFSGQHDIQIEGVETTGILKINLLFNLIYEEIFPVRVRLRTADPYAVLTMMVTRLVISKVGGTDPKLLIAEETRQRELADAIQEIDLIVEEQLGIRIIKVTLADVAFDAETQKFLELETRTRLQNEAAVAVATKDRTVQILANDAAADRVERVIRPTAENDRTVAVRVAEAYENNKVVTTYAPGASAMLPLGK
ncbi:MAG: hypothetical protein HYX23_00345 [Candidatus Zambryskibacteria bacterium]|nr:hypothetical protein [Candidatus Zambryskibacteria bacterium]